MTPIDLLRRLPFAALLALLCALLLLPSAARAEVPNKDAVPAYAEEQTIMQAEHDSVARSPGWGSSASGKVHVDRNFLGQYGASEGNVILQRGGNTWRVLRNGPMATLSGTVLLVVPLLLFGFYLMAGPARVEQRESGRRIVRFTAWERLVHWATAISFILLAVTGLLIMFGKLLIPLVGATAFSWLAIISKYVHNFIGPLFIVCSVIMFFTFLRRNVFRRWDWTWIKQGGGLISHKHIPADYFNAGEKIWFWGGVVLLGLVMSVTGLILDFVTVGQTRYVLQVANILHIVGATLYIAASLGHIYIGTLGTPGAYEGMRHGTVDEEWARTHHEIWYQKVIDGTPGAAPPGSGPYGPDTTSPGRAH
ncbi:formate dehydrogenase subunit gamma [Massilia sp. GCM10020059]|uniref:Formate dehydrogenase subunit gamma n=1 Tax=Massilia agrisoli TaxID=2892444 RepID=A0ABS8INZ2_9BURK|nr:formate dehydrogenase subunit gamma [Massilia agrisoli]MCC6069543.1 formate dehydrogenase subunit gamma [Massilia agrisoli]